MWSGNMDEFPDISPEMTVTEFLQNGAEIIDNLRDMCYIRYIWFKI